MSHRTVNIVLISAALLLVVGLVLAPHLPADKRILTEASPTDLRLLNGVAMVQSGENPMQGIAMIREVLDDDPTNVDAHWHLAQFSITSRQFENAAYRFEQVIAHDELLKYPDAYFWLAQTKVSLEQEGEAISLLEKYLTLTSDTVIINGVVRMIEQLKRDL